MMVPGVFRTPGHSIACGPTFRATAILRLHLTSIVPATIDAWSACALLESFLPADGKTMNALCALWVVAAAVGQTPEVTAVGKRVHLIPLRFDARAVDTDTARTIENI